ncbi:hypothetical protein AMECASPLE_029556 [Ameca splendens]|uniref:Uncharacterized protein n=1 Tax=Ameca splendens TaxID=208324 RepID=A0ABV0Y6C4_9TELE
MKMLAEQLYSNILPVKRLSYETYSEDSLVEDENRQTGSQVLESHTIYTHTCRAQVIQESGFKKMSPFLLFFYLTLMSNTLISKVERLVSPHCSFQIFPLRFKFSSHSIFYCVHIYSTLKPIMSINLIYDSEEVSVRKMVGEDIPR